MNDEVWDQAREICLNAAEEQSKIENGVTAHEWISVEVELPERGQLVLVFDTICYVAYADRKGLWHYYSPAGSYCSSTKNPSHWMPLPKPPKMDGGVSNAL